MKLYRFSGNLRVQHDIDGSAHVFDGTGRPARVEPSQLSDLAFTLTRIAADNDRAELEKQMGSLLVDVPPA